MADLTILCSAYGVANDAHAANCAHCRHPLPSAPVLLPPPHPVAPSTSAVPGTRTRGGSLAPDAVLNGRYRILGLLGTGGMGTVYKAADTHLGRRAVALKELSEQGLSPQEVAEATDAFEQEAHLLAGLHHPSLPSIHDHFTDGGRWYLVMDFIEGETLEDYLQRDGTPGLPVAAVLRLADQVGAVLAYLHRQTPPIIFRDLKPSNIMVTATDQLYLIDFGIARLFKPGRVHDTVSLGSPGYAAPEQYGTAQTTVRSDIFSFGVVLHALLTGIDPARTPFTFSPIQPWNPQTPPALEALIMRMVQLDENKRPPSMASIRHELNQIAEQADARQPTSTPPQLPVHVQRAYAGSHMPLCPMPQAYPNTLVSRRRTWRRLWLFAPLGAALLVVWGIAAMCSTAGTALSGLQQGAAVGNAQSTLNSDLYSLHSDVATLAQDSNFTTDLAAYTRDWAQTQKDYHAEQSDYQQGCGASGGNAAQVRGDAVTVHDDLIAIQDDDIAMGDDVRPFDPDLSQVQADIQTVKSDWTTLQEALAADAAGTAAVQSAADDVNTALSMAQQQVDASNKALQAAQAKTKQYDQEADQTNTAAQNLANSMHC